MLARERLYLTQDRSRLVRHGAADAAFLYAAEGDEIPTSAAERFGLVDGRLGKGKAVGKEPLHGSSTLATQHDVGGKAVQLGTLVSAAHKRSGLTPEAWNALDDADRDARITQVLEEWRTAAAAKAAKAAKPKAAAKEQKPAEDKEHKPAENKGG